MEDEENEEDECSMETINKIGLGLMFASVLFLAVGFLYVRQAEKALLSGHETGQAGECLHPEGAVCPYQALNAMAVPKFFGLFGVVVMAAVGAGLFTHKKQEEKMVSKAKEASRKLEGDDAKILDLVVQSNGMIYQNELVEKTGLSKVKITRILDRLEGMGLVERRRRGMTNVIILK